MQHDAALRHFGVLACTPRHLFSVTSFRTLDLRSRIATVSGSARRFVGVASAPYTPTRVTSRQSSSIIQVILLVAFGLLR